MEVAVSISAELLILTTPHQTTSARRGLPWHQLRGLIQNTDAKETTE
jgi:hypothetical protein